MYDLPAMLDYVLRVTGDPDLHFVGHSMGATAAVVMLSERREYNSKLKVTLLLAPVVKLEHNTSIFRHSAPLWKALQVSGPAEAISTAQGIPAVDHCYRRFESSSGCVYARRLRA
jgi:pimeloyl-ACP methyl ester carboxylesterase